MSVEVNVVKQRGHPGKGQKKTRLTNRGRQVTPQALTEIEQLLSGQALRRDLLIEYLHLIQDQYGQLGAQHLAALASLMHLSQTEVYEVATFYAHFDVVKEDEADIQEITIRVCDSIACQLAGAEALYDATLAQANANVRVLKAPCMGRCEVAPVAEVGHKHFVQTDAEQLIQAALNKDTHASLPQFIGFEQYQQEGGYQLLRQCLQGELSDDAVISELSDSNLRGLGGAGFPTGRKWGIVKSFDGPRLMAVNGDEGEPGTFKDRHYLETNPHQFIEGTLIAAKVVDVQTCYIYMRDEYPHIIALLKQEIEKVRAKGLADHVNIEVRRGAGAYICGEESAMIESIEGKRGLPRNRPPFVAQKGIFDLPTLVNNVETLYWVPKILKEGASWFTSAGMNGRKGWRSFSVSGRVKNPGVKLAPAGITLRQLVEDYCGGMQDGHKLKGYLPGGASGGILPASLADVPLDFDTLHEYGCFIGSAAVVVFSDADNMKDVALNLMRFFEDESCGQCTPCRVGTEKAVKLMCKPTWDTALLSDLSKVMTDASICGLGQAAGNPINSVIKYFAEDLA